MVRRLLSFEDRAQISVGLQQGLSDAEIGELLGRDRTVIWRERRRNSLKTRGYRPVHANEFAKALRQRPQVSKINADPVLAARVRADLRRSRTPRQIAGRLQREATDVTGGACEGLPARGRQDRFARGAVSVDLRPPRR